MSLLDLGLDVSTPPANQAQQPQQQSQTTNPFGDLQNVSEQQQSNSNDLFGMAQPPPQHQQPFGLQQQSSQQQQPSNSDPFGAPQQPQSNNVDPFGLQQPTSENSGGKTIPPQQQQQEQDKSDGFEAAFGEAPTPVTKPLEALQPHELNFGVFEEQKDSAPAQQEVSSNKETESADTGSGSGVGETSAETGNESVSGQAVKEPAQGTSGVVKEKLKEIESLFGGKWRLLRSDPYGEYLKAIGVGLLTRNRASGGTPDIEISVLHEYIFINTSSMLHSQITKLKLDESVENVVFKANLSVFCTYQNQKLELQMTPVDLAWGKTQGVEYSLSERGELMVVYASGSNVCRRYFSKVTQVSK